LDRWQPQSLEKKLIVEAKVVMMEMDAATIEGGCQKRSRGMLA
jgi:hypothetical protein